MNFLKILDQKVNLRDIKEFSDYIRRFYMTKCENILFNCCLKVTLGVK